MSDSLVERAKDTASEFADSHPRAVSTAARMGNMALMGFALGAGVFIANRLFGRKGRVLHDTSVGVSVGGGPQPAGQAILPARGSRFG